MVDTLSFRSRDYDDAEGFSAYYDLYAGGSTTDRLDSTFRAEVTGFRYPRMIVFDRVLAGISHERDYHRVARDGFNHVSLHLVRSGTLLVSVENGYAVVEPGRIVVFDMTRPQKTWSDAAEVIT